MIDRLTDISSTFGAFLDSEAFWLVLLVFYPIYGLLYRRRSAMMAFVVAFSLLFAYKVGGLIALSVLVKAVVDYWLSVWLSNIRSRSRRRALLVCCVLLSVGVLVWFKCDGGMMQSVASIVGANFRLTDTVVPVGISFYTFRSVSYMVDVYRGVIIAPRRMLDYVFYLTYFPVLVAGPIVRAAEFFPQLEGNRRITPPMLYAGLFLMMKGLLKKAVVADYLAQFNNLVFDNPAGYSGTEALLALLGYSAQIYLDFSGYSDIAIGMSRTLGIELPLNFRSPYKSVSITEFWRRWHISLSSWLRDYIYIPLGGSRCGRWRTRFNLLLTMAVGGAWHGAGFTFVVLGVGTRHGIGCAEGILTAGVAVACAAAGVDSRYVCFCHGYVASVPLRLACRHGGDVLSHFYGFQTGSNRGIRAGTCRMDADADRSLCAYIPARPDVGVGGATLCRDALVWQIIAALPVVAAHH